jgi:hypothetical protein
VSCETMLKGLTMHVIGNPEGKDLKKIELEKIT